MMLQLQGVQDAIDSGKRSDWAWPDLVFCGDGCLRLSSLPIIDIYLFRTRICLVAEFGHNPEYWVVSVALLSSHSCLLYCTPNSNLALESEWLSLSYTELPSFDQTAGRSCSQFGVAHDIASSVGVAARRKSALTLANPVGHYR